REEEIVEELSQDLEERFEQALDHGASEEEAKQLALDELNKPDSLGEQLRRVERSVRHPSQTIGAKSARHRFADVWYDIRFAVRMLTKQSGFAVVAILTIGIGIGMSTLMLSIAHDVLIRPLPYANSDRLYAVYARSDSAGQTRIAASGPDYLDYREQNKSFNRIAEYLPRFTFTWTGDGEPKLVNCTAASEDFFATLGIRPYLGRLYEAREYTYFKNDTIIVSYRFWKNQLGGDLEVIGRRIRLQDESVAIVGVLPPMSDLFPETDVWPKLTTRPSYPF